jgi:hypothetical protein
MHSAQVSKESLPSPRHILLIPINKLQLFLLYFFPIVKERNYLVDQMLIKPKSLSLSCSRSGP